MCQRGLRKTRDYRDIAKDNATEEIEQMLRGTAGEFRKAAKAFKPSTAKRLDNFSFTDFAVASGKPARELDAIIEMCVREFALPARELRHGGSCLPKNDGGEGMIAIIGAFAANFVVPLRKWDK